MATQKVKLHFVAAFCEMGIFKRQKVKLMRFSMRNGVAIAMMAAFGLIAGSGQAQPPGGGRGGPAEFWWVNKTEGGVYKSPMRPLWRLADLKKMHEGQNNWSQQIILDPEQDATYNSAAPGTHFTTRLHP